MGILAKIGGWAQFALQLLTQFSSAGAPHGWASWLVTIASFAAAVGIHAASESSPATPATK